MSLGAWLLVGVVLIAVSFGEHWYNNLSSVQHRADNKDLARLSAWVNGPLYFRRMTESDLDFATEASLDPITMLANGSEALDAPQLHDVYRQLISDYWWLMLVGAERSTDQAVGWTTLQDSPVGPEDAISIGLTLHPDFRGKGYGRQLLGAAIASQRGPFQRRPSSREVFVGTAVDNKPMQRIMTQLGYEAEPTTSDYNAPNGEVFASLWYRCGPATPEPKFG